VQPSITVSPFVLDAYEVTVARFRRWSVAGRPAPTGPIAYPGGMIPWAGTARDPAITPAQCNWSATAGRRELHPINCADWWSAQAFCVWDGGRLPTEAEWEWAARARPGASLPVPRRYPWGNSDPGTACDRCQWNFCAGEDGATTRRVGSFAPTPDLFDLGGNVRELVADSYTPYTDATCWGARARSNPLCDTGPLSNRVFRGGSWCSNTIDTVQSATRLPRAPTGRDDYIGFRCAR
jgi:formylglycine-generating enzyme required for sulfatase activity